MNARPDSTIREHVAHVIGEPRLLVTRKELAALLARGERTIRTLQQQGKIGPQPIQLGAEWLYRLPEVIAWLDAVGPDGKLPDRDAWQRLRSQQHR